MPARFVNDGERIVTHRHNDLISRPQRNRRQCGRGCQESKSQDRTRHANARRGTPPRTQEVAGGCRSSAPIPDTSALGCQRLASARSHILTSLKLHRFIFKATTNRRIHRENVPQRPHTMLQLFFRSRHRTTPERPFPKRRSSASQEGQTNEHHTSELQARELTPPEEVTPHGMEWRLQEQRHLSQHPQEKKPSHQAQTRNWRWQERAPRRSTGTKSQERTNGHLT